MLNRVRKIISLAVKTALFLASALAQDKPNAAPAAKRQKGTAADDSTPGRIPKCTGKNKALGESNITEDESGDIGIGTTLAPSKLTVDRVIELMGAQG